MCFDPTLDSWQGGSAWLEICVGISWRRQSCAVFSYTERVLKHLDDMWMGVDDG